MIINKIKYIINNHSFVFVELVKRDFTKKYKRTILGMLWSILSPLIMLSILAVIFGNFFGRDIPHFVIYLFTGQVVYNYFVESTNEGMRALLDNASIFTKINVPKYLFLFSKNVSALINFGIILCIYFLSILISDLNFSWKFILLVYPIGCLILINLGIGFVLSAVFIFFRDTEYIYRLFTQIVMYGSAIFYDIKFLPEYLRCLFYCNPIFVCIDYFRSIVIFGNIPSLSLHLLLAFYALGIFSLGCWIYKKFNYKFLYYV